MNLYVYYWGHNGDALTTRPLLRRLKDLGHDVVVGCYFNHAYLFADLGIPVAVSPFDDNCGYTYDEVRYYHKDRGRFADKLVSAWCGTYPDLDEKYGHSWANICATVLRQTQIVELCMTDITQDVPMIFDWKVRHPYSNLPWEIQHVMHRRLIYLENGHTRSEHCGYEFDTVQLSKDFPNNVFVCTAPHSATVDTQVINANGLDLLRLSRLSEFCVAIVGKGSGPFFATFTEANRTKPRCVVGYETKAPYKGPFWPYPGNATQYLKTTEELYQFLERL